MAKLRRKRHPPPEHRATTDDGPLRLVARRHANRQVLGGTQLRLSRLRKYRASLRQTLAKLEQEGRRSTAPTASRRLAARRRRDLGRPRNRNLQCCANSSSLSLTL